MNISVTGSIVIYKCNPDIVLKTVNSFLNCKLNIFLIIIDNSPSNVMQCFFENQSILYIHNPSNPGFGASHNLAIRKSFEYNSTYHLVLNPDIYFDEGTIENIFLFMNQNHNFGHLMPRILFPDHKIQYLCKTNPTFFDLFVRGFFPNFLKGFFKNRIDKYVYKNKDYNNLIFNVPYLSGCFMFFRVSTLKKVGLFDENIFMYLEDADMTRRFLEVSDNIYFSDATVYHYYAGLTHKEIKYKIITIKSAIYYFNKWGWYKNLY